MPRLSESEFLQVCATMLGSATAQQKPFPSGDQSNWGEKYADMQILHIPYTIWSTIYHFCREPLIESGVEWLNPRFRGRGPGWNNAATEDTSPPVLDPSPFLPRPSSFPCLHSLLFQLNLQWICLRRCQRHQRQQRSPAKFSPLQYSLQ